MKKIIFIVAALLVVAVASIFVRNYYSQLTLKKSLVNEVVDFPVVFQNDKDTIAISQLKDKWVLFYFWDSDSSEKAISIFQEINDSRITNDDEVKIYSIYCHSEENTVSTPVIPDILKENGTTTLFPLSANDPLLQNLKINSFPSAIIINREGNIVFRGSADSALMGILVLTYSM
ncbi:MAG: hypothetical protein LBV43_06425 [Prevotella sp.]|jgi:hypothetical protein|nr:hypothetical protein [Prevotella sp.]